MKDHLEEVLQQVLIYKERGISNRDILARFPEDEQAIREYLEIMSFLKTEGKKIAPRPSLAKDILEILPFETHKREEETENIFKRTSPYGVYFRFAFAGVCAVFLLIYFTDVRTFMDGVLGRATRTTYVSENETATFGEAINTFSMKSGTIDAESLPVDLEEKPRSFAMQKSVSQGGVTPTPSAAIPYITVAEISQEASNVAKLVEVKDYFILEGELAREDIEALLASF